MLVQSIVLDCRIIQDGYQLQCCLPHLFKFEVFQCLVPTTLHVSHSPQIPHFPFVCAHVPQTAKKVTKRLSINHIGNTNEPPIKIKILNLFTITIQHCDSAKAHYQFYLLCVHLPQWLIFSTVIKNVKIPSLILKLNNVALSLSQLQCCMYDLVLNQSHMCLQWRLNQK